MIEFPSLVERRKAWRELTETFPNELTSSDYALGMRVFNLSRKHKDALSIFKSMQTAGLEPDSQAIRSAIVASTGSRMWHEYERIIRLALEKNLEIEEQHVTRSLEMALNTPARYELAKRLFLRFPDSQLMTYIPASRLCKIAFSKNDVDLVKKVYGSKNPEISRAGFERLIRFDLLEEDDSRLRETLSSSIETALVLAIDNYRSIINICLLQQRLTKLAVVLRFLQETGNLSEFLNPLVNLLQKDSKLENIVERLLQLLQELPSNTTISNDWRVLLWISSEIRKSEIVYNLSPGSIIELWWKFFDEYKEKGSLIATDFAFIANLYLKFNRLDQLPNVYKHQDELEIPDDSLSLSTRLQATLTFQDPKEAIRILRKMRSMELSAKDLDLLQVLHLCMSKGDYELTKEAYSVLPIGAKVSSRAYNELWDAAVAHKDVSYMLNILRHVADAARTHRDFCSLIDSCFRSPEQFQAFISGLFRLKTYQNDSFMYFLKIAQVSASPEQISQILVEIDTKKIGIPSRVFSSLNSKINQLERNPTESDSERQLSSTETISEADLTRKRDSQPHNSTESKEEKAWKSALADKDVARLFELVESMPAPRVNTDLSILLESYFENPEGDGIFDIFQKNLSFLEKNHSGLLQTFVYWTRKKGSSSQIEKLLSYIENREVPVHSDFLIKTLRRTMQIRKSQE
jgi:pentatricopeptide repeat protein